MTARVTNNEIWQEANCQRLGIKATMKARDNRLLRPDRVTSLDWIKRQRKPASLKDQRKVTGSDLKAFFDPRIDLFSKGMDLPADEGRANCKGDKNDDDLGNEGQRHLLDLR